MTIELILFSSPLHPGFDLATAHRELFASISADHDIRFTEPTELRTNATATAPTAADATADLRVVFIASGGTENQFVDTWDRLPRPVYLLTDGKHNSLAASLEISAWVRSQGVRCEILHGEPHEVSLRLADLAAVERALGVLSSSRMGFIGAPSDWLIASSVDRDVLRDRFGAETEDVDLEDLYRYIDDVDADESRSVAADLRSRSSAVVEPDDEALEPDDEALEQAAAIYLGLKQLIEDRGMTAVTVRCFDLVTRYHNTGCLALALLNDEGIMAGCEGDQQALFTVVVAHALTGEIPFLANPAALDTSENAVEIAHCMVATRVVGSFRLRSHFETGIGVAIEGNYEDGDLTIMRIGARDLSRAWVSEAEPETAEHSEERCRTQLRLKLDRDVRYFLDGAVANHHVAVRGRWADRFDAFFARTGIEA